MDDIAILKTPHHMDDRVHLADIAQKLVPQTLTFGSALHKPGDIHELNGRGCHLLGMVHIPQKLQPLVRHHNADIRVDGAERVIGGFRSCLCQ